MRDVLEIEIKASLEKVAALFADPQRTPEWMQDTEYQPLTGKAGEPGSRYQLTQREGKITFVATVVRLQLPREVEILLEAPKLRVSVTGRFTPSSPTSTQLISEEVFRFKGAINKIFGLLAFPAIKAAHRRQMQSFKRFAECEASSGLKGRPTAARD